MKATIIYRVSAPLLLAVQKKEEIKSLTIRFRCAKLLARCNRSFPSPAPPLEDIRLCILAVSSPPPSPSSGSSSVHPSSKLSSGLLVRLILPASPNRVPGVPSRDKFSSVNIPTPRPLPLALLAVAGGLGRPLLIGLGGSGNSGGSFPMKIVELNDDDEVRDEEWLWRGPSGGRGLLAVLLLFLGLPLPELP